MRAAVAELEKQALASLGPSSAGGGGARPREELLAPLRAPLRLLSERTQALLAALAEAVGGKWVAPSAPPPSEKQEEVVGEEEEQETQQQQMPKGVSSGEAAQKQQHYQPSSVVFIEQQQAAGTSGGGARGPRRRSPSLTAGAAAKLQPPPLERATSSEKSQLQQREQQREEEHSWAEEQAEALGGVDPALLRLDLAVSAAEAALRDFEATYAGVISIHRVAHRRRGRPLVASGATLPLHAMLFASRRAVEAAAGAARAVRELALLGDVEERHMRAKMPRRRQRRRRPVLEAIAEAVAGRDRDAEDEE